MKYISRGPAWDMCVNTTRIREVIQVLDIRVFELYIYIHMSLSRSILPSPILDKHNLGHIYHGFLMTINLWEKYILKPYSYNIIVSSIYPS